MDWELAQGAIILLKSINPRSFVKELCLLALLGKGESPVWLNNLNGSKESQLVLTPNKENQSVIQNNLLIFCGKTFHDL